MLGDFNKNILALLADLSKIVQNICYRSYLGDLIKFHSYEKYIYTNIGSCAVIVVC